MTGLNVQLLGQILPQRKRKRGELGQLAFNLARDINIYTQIHNIYVIKARNRNEY